MSILITGANGFLGTALACRLLSDRRTARLAVRRSAYNGSKVAGVIFIPGLAPDTDWTQALHSIKTIVHCAGRVHIEKEMAADPLEAFRCVNVQGTLRLAQQAAKAGVKRFILISSIGVNGAETFGQAFKADDIPAPHSPYARSKWEIEQALWALSLEMEMEIVVIRAPMIYGRNAPGNFMRLWRAVCYQIPLPFAKVNNMRSFVAIDNVVDLIVTCIDHPQAANQLFLVSDGVDLSTPTFIRRIAKAANKVPILFSVPDPWLKKVARLLGREKQLSKITGSLQIDIQKTVQMLSWTPVIGVDEALEKVMYSRDNQVPAFEQALLLRN